MAARLDSAVDCKDYADPAAQVDLIAEGGSACRRIRPLGDGNLVVTMIRLGTSVTRTIAVHTDVDEDIQALTVEAATNIAFRVYW